VYSIHVTQGIPISFIMRVIWFDLIELGIQALDADIEPWSSCYQYSNNC
jgi:hypothetical protein